jgi:hypothetical protein
MKSKLNDQNNCEKLIELIRENPVLYDCSRKEYKDADIVTNTWKSIISRLEIPGLTGKIID